MNDRMFRFLLCLMLLGFLSAAAWAQGAKDAKPNTAPAKAEPAKSEPTAAKSDAPATHTVKKGPLKITVDVDGVFEARSTAEIVIRLDEYVPAPALVVANAAKHGAHVRKGDVLLTLETEKLDKMIDDLRTDLKLSELGLKQAEDSLATLEKTTPLDLAANERAEKINVEDRKYYFDVQRPFNLKMADFNLKRARNSLEYTEEELRQLEKMYAADEVTEETEAIVLKRARDQLESAEMMVQTAQMSRDHTVNFDIPRTDDRTKESSQRRELETARAKISLPEALKRQQIEVEKQRVQHARSAERLKNLTADRERLTVRSPIEGVVYHGKCTRGKFGDSQTLAESLRPAGAVQMNQVLMTVVQPQVMTIRATIPEDQLHRLRPGLSGIATPNGFPELKLPASLSQWSEIPIGPGSFDATLRVNLDKAVKSIAPGMACKVKLTAYVKKDALLLPASAVLTDELDDHRYVYLLGKDGKSSKRDVTVGEKTDKVVEIVKGLAEGDRVLQEAPKDGK